LIQSKLTVLDILFKNSNNNTNIEKRFSILYTLLIFYRVIFSDATLELYFVNNRSASATTISSKLRQKRTNNSQIQDIKKSRLFKN